MLDHPELFILRHGETQWNRRGWFQGRKDSPLTEKGRQQAANQRKLLNTIDIAPRNVFASPLGRAVETARLAVPFGGCAVEDDRLQEIDFGEWEGVTREEIRYQIDYSFDDGSWNFKSPGGETFEMIAARSQDFLNDLDEPAVIVTHGVTSIVLRGLCMGLDQAGMLKLPKDQGCIFHLADGRETILR